MSAADLGFQPAAFRHVYQFTGEAARTQNPLFDGRIVLRD